VRIPPLQLLNFVMRLTCDVGGPFEYWLRKTRAVNIRDGGVIDDCLSSLVSGTMPNLLRRHSRAAAGMPLP
jgi:hypothetical protein